MQLALGPGAEVFHFHRLGFADDEPVALEYCTVLAAALPSACAVGAFLVDAMAKAGSRPVRALQRLRALLLNDEQARRLQVELGEAGLLAERVGYLRRGQAVGLSQPVCRGENHDLVAELNGGYSEKSFMIPGSAPHLES